MIRFILAIFVITLVLSSCQQKDGERDLNQFNHSNHDQNSKQVDDLAEVDWCKKQIEQADSIMEQVKLGFQYLEDYTVASSDESFLNYVMEKFEELLQSPESIFLTMEDLHSLSKGIKIIPFEYGQLINYRGSPSNYGESAPVDFTFWRIIADNDVEIFRVFYQDSRHPIFVIGLNDQTFIVGGIDMSRPRTAFIGRIHLLDDTLHYSPAVQEFEDESWRVIDGSDLIRRIDDLMMETSIEEMNAQSARIISSDGKQLRMMFDESLFMYRIDL